MIVYIQSSCLTVACVPSYASYPALHHHHLPLLLLQTHHQLLWAILFQWASPCSQPPYADANLVLGFRHRLSAIPGPVILNFLKPAPRFEAIMFLINVKNCLFFLLFLKDYKKVVYSVYKEISTNNTHYNIKIGLRNVALLLLIR